MDEKKWRLIDDNVVVSLVNDFKTKWWSNRVMEEEICASSKAIAWSFQ